MAPRIKLAEFTRRLNANSSIDITSRPTPAPIEEESGPFSVVGGPGSSRLGGIAGSFVEGLTSGYTAPLEAIEEVGTTAYGAATDQVLNADDVNTPIDLATGAISGVGNFFARPNPEHEGKVPEMLAQGVGSAASFILGGGALKLLGVGAKATTLGMTALGSGQIADEVVNDLIATNRANGVETTNADKAAALGLGGAVGTTEALPFMRVMDRFTKAKAGEIVNPIKQVLTGTLEEAGQEGLQSLLTNFIASDLIKYDPERQIYEDTAKSAGLGGGVGFLVNTLMVGLGIRTRTPMGKIEKAAEEADTSPILGKINKISVVNPVTGEPLTNSKVKVANLALTQAKHRLAKPGISEEQQAKEQATIDKIEGHLGTLASNNKDEAGAEVDPILAQEIADVLSGKPAEPSIIEGELADPEPVVEDALSEPAIIENSAPVGESQEIDELYEAQAALEGARSPEVVQEVETVDTVLDPISEEVHNAPLSPLVESLDNEVGTEFPADVNVEMNPPIQEVLDDRLPETDTSNESLVEEAATEEVDPRSVNGITPENITGFTEEEADLALPTTSRIQARKVGEQFPDSLEKGGTLITVDGQEVLLQKYDGNGAASNTWNVATRDGKFIELPATFSLKDAKKYILNNPNIRSQLLATGTPAEVVTTETEARDFVDVSPEELSQIIDERVEVIPTRTAQELKEAVAEPAPEVETISDLLDNPSIDSLTAVIFDLEQELSDAQEYGEPTSDIRKQLAAGRRLLREAEAVGVDKTSTDEDIDFALNLPTEIPYAAGLGILTPNRVGSQLTKPSVRARLSKEFKEIIHKFNERSRTDVVIHYAETSEDLPDHVLKAIANKKVDHQLVNGFVYTPKGEAPSIYIVGNRHATSEELIVTTVHELVGHIGMREMFATLLPSKNGKDAYHNFLDKESKNSVKLFAGAVNLMYTRGYKHLFTTSPSSKDDMKVSTPDGDLYLSEDNRVKVFDEYIAHETKSLVTQREMMSKFGSFLNRMHTLIKHLFRKIGLNSSELTVNDVRTLINESHTRMFNWSKSASSFLADGRAPKYQASKYLDERSPYKDEALIAAVGAAPSDSWLAEQVIYGEGVESFSLAEKKSEANLEKGEESDVLKTSRIVTSDNSGVELQGNFLERRVNAIWDRIKKTSRFQKFMRKRGSVKALPGYNAWAGALQRALGGIHTPETMAKKLNKTMKKFNHDQNVAVMKFYTTVDADVNSIPDISDKVKADLVASKEAIMAFGDELVDLGVLSADKHSETRGMYLPKVYYKHMSEHIGGTSGKRIGFMGYLRKQADMERSEEIDLGKIENPGFIVPDLIGTLGRDIALLKLTKEIGDISGSLDLGWVLDTAHKVKYLHKGKEVHWTFHQLEAELERMEKQSLDGVNGVMHKMSSDDHAMLMQRIKYTSDTLKAAEGFREAEIKKHLLTQGVPEADITDERINTFKHDNYVEMPKDHAYGALSGKWVMKPIRDSFVDGMSDDVGRQGHEEFFRTLQAGHQWWKAGKVALNVPVSTVRNTVGNLSLLDLSTDTNSVKLLSMLGSELKGFLSGDKSEAWKLVEEYGGFGTTYAAQELNLVKRGNQQRLKALKAKEISSSSVAAFHSSKEFVMNGINEVIDFYGGQEGIFKVVAFKDFLNKWEKQNGQSLNSLEPAMREAVILKGISTANDAIFNYSEVPSLIAAIRRNIFFGAPFVTFTYKAALKVPENFMKHPQKFIKYAVLMSTMASNAIAAFMDADWDEEEANEAMKLLADYYDANKSVYLVPWKDSNGRIQIVDLTPFVPHAQLVNLSAAVNLAGANVDGAQGVMDATKALMNYTGLGSTPITNLMIAMNTGLDPFSGREISREGYTGKEKVEAWTRYLASSLLPPVITESGGMGHILDNAGIDTGVFSTGRELNRFGEDRESTGQALARVVGINAVPVGIDLARSNVELSRLREVGKLKKARSRIDGDRNISEIERATKIGNINLRIDLLNKKYNNKLN